MRALLALALLLVPATAVAGTAEDMKRPCDDDVWRLTIDQAARDDPVAKNKLHRAPVQILYVEPMREDEGGGCLAVIAMAPEKDMAAPPVNYAYRFWIRAVANRPGASVFIGAFVRTPETSAGP